MASNNAKYCTNAFSISSEGVYSGTADSLAFSGGHSCACGGWRDELVYRDTTLPSRWNATLFCELLGKQTMLFVGDSTMQQTASALMSSVTFYGGACARQLTFAPADTLVGRDFGVLNRGRHWADWVRELRPTILVLSVGAHLAEAKINDSTFENLLREILSEYSQSFAPSMSLVWRTQFPGGCEPPRVEKHNYARFPQWDAEAFELVLSHGGQVLNLTALYSRPEAHIGSRPSSPYPQDCLHFCQTALYDLVSRSFLSLLHTMPMMASLKK